MKKNYFLFIVLFLLAIPFSSFGQGGSGIAVEYTASPFGSSSFLTPGNIRAKFLAGNLGFRLGLNTTVSNNEPEPTTITHVGFFDLRPGAEFHTTIGGKASPYAGAELIIMNRSSNLNSTSQLGIANATNEFGANQAYFGFGGALFAGIDYYIGEKFYFGFEVGLDLVNLTYKDVTMADEIIIESTKDFSMNTNFANTLKLGLNF